MLQSGDTSVCRYTPEPMYQGLPITLRATLVVCAHGLTATACATSGAPVAGPAPQPKAPSASAQIASRAAGAPATDATAHPKGKAGPTEDVDKAEEDPDQPPGVETVPVPVDGTSLVRGRSTVTVNAPIEKVREGILGFARYPEFMPHYSNCRVLGRTPTGGRDVYMEVEALHGAVHMWARIDVPKPAVADGLETYDTKFLDGNVRDFKAIWRLRKVDDAKTQLSLEVFLNPKIPLPDGLINGENLSGSAKGVAAMRSRIEAAAR
jgi:ribosome-associated toxin RatA of RatAB toxin-antitoxin module